MTDAMPTDPSRSNNLIDRAAQSADEALKAARRAADSVIDSVVDKVHGIRDTASPVMESSRRSIRFLSTRGRRR